MRNRPGGAVLHDNDERDEPIDDNKCRLIDNHANDAFKLLFDIVDCGIDTGRLNDFAVLDLLTRARDELSAAIDLLDHDRQPVDGSPPDAAD